MKKLYISLAALALLSTAGCKKYLEHAPDQRTEVNTVDKVAQLLTSAYPQANYIAFTEAASDNAEDRGAGYALDRISTLPFLWQDNDDNDNDTPTDYWNASYAAIAAANQALVAIENASDKTGYAPYKGEALLARAYAHFMLVTLYSQIYTPGGDNSSPGVPYVTTPEKVVSQQYTRGTVASVYDAIQKDLEEGLPLIQNQAYGVPKYHFNVAAAHAFAARFYLFKADYAKVVEHASTVSPGNSFATILRPWTTRYRNYTSAEMNTNFTQATEPSTLLLIETPSSWARTTSARFGFGQTISDKYFGSNNVTGARWGHGLYLYGSPNYTFLKFKEYFVKTSQNATIGYPYTIVPVLTADETLLNRAEAYANLGQNDLALQDLNTFCSTRIANFNVATNGVTLPKIAAFYGLPSPKEGLIQTVLEFKKAEFIQEGIRWLDIVRLKIPVTHRVVKFVGQPDVYTLPADDKRRLFQLPSQVKLSGIEQNPR